MATLNDRGHEILDDTPVAIPLRFSRPPSRMEEMKQLLRLAQYEAMTSGRMYETPQEADDFDVGDDFDPTTPYELSQDNEIAEWLFDSPVDPGAAAAPAAAAPAGEAKPDGGAPPMQTPAD